MDIRLNIPAAPIILLKKIETIIKEELIFLRI